MKTSQSELYGILKKIQLELDVKTKRLEVLAERIAELQLRVDGFEAQHLNDKAFMKKTKKAGVVSLVHYNELLKKDKLNQLNIEQTKRELASRVSEQKRVKDTIKHLNEELSKTNKKINTFGSVVELKKNENKYKKKNRRRS